MSRVGERNKTSFPCIHPNAFLEFMRSQSAKEKVCCANGGEYPENGPHLIIRDGQVFRSALHLPRLPPRLWDNQWHAILSSASASACSCAISEMVRQTYGPPNLRHRRAPFCIKVCHTTHETYQFFLFFLLVVRSEKETRQRKSGHEGKYEKETWRRRLPFPTCCCALSVLNGRALTKRGFPIARNRHGNLMNFWYHIRTWHATMAHKMNAKPYQGTPRLASGSKTRPGHPISSECLLFSNSPWRRSRC